MLTPQHTQKHLEVSLRFWLAGVVLILVNGRTGWPTASGRSRRPRTSEKIGSETERKAALATVVKEMASRVYLGAYSNLIH